jgi:proline iminopeptidase
MLAKVVFPALLALGLLACDPGPPATGDGPAPAGASSSPSEAGAYLPVPGGRIWYLRTGAGGATPVILLHGGPGFPSHYLKPLEALGADRPVIRYDQLGSGRSGATTDTTLFTIERFVAELDSLRSALGLERIHVLGHSWGSILGFEYYRAHPERVASLVLASAALEIPAWLASTRRMVGTLSDSAQEAIRVREASAEYGAPDYLAAMEEFYALYVWRHPVQADLDSTMAGFNQTLYGHMWGPSEFTATGTLKTYDATPLLGSVAVPTLYTVGEFDEADPETIRRHAAMTPGARFALIPGAAHVTTWDNPAATLAAVRDFLREVDAGGGRSNPPD